MHYFYYFIDTYLFALLLSIYCVYTIYCYHGVPDFDCLCSVFVYFHIMRRLWYINLVIFLRQSVKKMQFNFKLAHMFPV